MKNRYDIVYSNDKNQNEKASLSFSLIIFVLETFEFPCFLSSRTISTFFTIQKTPNLCTHGGCTRAKPFFPPVLNPATIPNNTQTFGKDTSERYCELFLVSDFSVTFSPQSFSQHVIPTTFAQNQVDIQSETKEDVYNCTRLLYDRSPESVTFLAQISFLLIPFIFPRRDYTLMPFE